MKKNKFKVLGFASLALLMACTGTFVFAPLTTSAHEEPTTTTGLGLDPKNDPVVYTTESGLEIRMSNADKFASATTFTTNTGVSVQQDLTSFYYFTMGTYSGTIYTGDNGSTTASYTCTNEPVNWIILGVGSHSTAFVESVSNYLFSTIKNNDYLFSNGEYYFDNQHETFSPAGSLIDSTVNTKTYLMGKVKDSITVHTEIPKGCMLVLSEKALGQTYFNSSGALNYRVFAHSPQITTQGANTSYGDRYRYKGDINTSTNEAQTWNNKTDGDLYAYINNLFSKNTSGTILKNGLGFTQAQADLIVPQQLYTSYSNGNGYPLTETPSTDGGTYYTMFPLAMGTESNSYTSGTQNFVIGTYIPLGSKRIVTYIGSNRPTMIWFRSGSHYSADAATAMHVTGGQASNNHVSNVFGVRPAMVMKLSQRFSISDSSMPAGASRPPSNGDEVAINIKTAI